ncbi:MAG: tripartite tricarboxylate transporter permease [Oscillospiraceae bacterium]
MEYILGSLQMIFTPLGIVLMLSGVVLGAVLGAIPGLSGGLGIMLLLPATFGMDTNYAFILIISIWVGGISGSFIAAVLLGIPGSPASIATCFDGHPLSQKGYTEKALSVGIVSNAMGTIPSACIAMFLSPVIAMWAVKFGPWEYFSLGFCAIMLVVTLSQDDMARGLAAGFIGILVGCAGLAPLDGASRFTFGSMWLSGGFEMIVVMLGIFAIKQVLLDYSRGFTDPPPSKGKVGKFDLTFQEVKDNKINILRSFFVGLWIGFLPGMGGGLSNMVSYAQEKKANKHPEKFGTGCIEGIFAPEVSNNAAIGGAMIPMAALGIPGDATAAIILGGLTLHGLEPGPLLYVNKPQLVYLLFVTCMLAGVAILVIEILGMPLFPKVLQIPSHYLFTTIMVLVFVGAYSCSNTIFNCFIVLVFALLGVVMEYGGLPTSPFMLCYILSNMLETNFRKAFTYSDRGLAEFFLRPLSCLFLIIALGSVLMPVIKKAVSKKKNAGQIL